MLSKMNTTFVRMKIARRCERHVRLCAIDGLPNDQTLYTLYRDVTTEGLFKVLT